MWPFREDNWLCRTFGHWWQNYTDTGGVKRRTCRWDGKTEPPFRLVQQFKPYDWLPDNEQPPGAI